MNFRFFCVNFGCALFIQPEIIVTVLVSFPRRKVSPFQMSQPNAGAKSKDLIYCFRAHRQTNKQTDRRQPDIELSLGNKEHSTQTK